MAWSITILVVEIMNLIGICVSNVPFAVERRSITTSHNLHLLLLSYFDIKEVIPLFYDKLNRKFKLFFRGSNLDSFLLCQKCRGLKMSENEILSQILQRVTRVETKVDALTSIETTADEAKRSEERRVGKERSNR